MTGTALLLAATIGCGSPSRDDREPAPLEPVAQLTPVPPDPADDKPGFIAVLTPKQLADVTAPHTSASAKLAVKLGDTVTQGQLLAQLDDRQLRQDLDAARAQLRTAQAAIAQSEVERRGAEIVLARETEAEAAHVSSRAEVSSARQALDKATAALAVARAAAQERATWIAQLQAHLADMTLRSPIGGSIALVYPQDGARVEEGQPVLRIISGGVFVKLAIPADQAGTIKPGDLVDLRLDQRPAPLTAKVGHRSPELDAVAQMIIADAELVDAPADLQPGMVGRIVPRKPAK